jgi:hypothetical protein
MSGEWGYVIAAYVITWVVLVGYGAYLWAGSKAASRGDGSALHARDGR